MSPSESRKLSGICPVCHRPLTKGVDERVENLADRPYGFRPNGVIDYVHLLPLHEVIGTALDVDSLSSTSVWNKFNSLITAFGNEYSILFDVPLQSLEEVVEPQMAEIILRVRNDKVIVIPGYDGVYGRLEFKPSEKNFPKKKFGLERWM